MVCKQYCYFSQPATILIKAGKKYRNTTSDVVVETCLTNTCLFSDISLIVILIIRISSTHNTTEAKTKPQ